MFSLTESCCCFWFVISQRQWEFKKRQKWTISWVICPSNAHKSNVQSFPEIKNSLTGRLRLCIVRESNLCQQLGRLLCYHYTNDAAKVCDRGDESQNFQTWNFPDKYSECHIRKNQHYSLRSGVVFSLTRLICFSPIESCRFVVCYFSRTLVLKKRQEFTISWIFCPSNAHNSNVQSFPEKKYAFTGCLSLRIVRESNPCQPLGRLLCYQIYWNLLFLEYFVPLTHTIVIFNLSLKRNTFYRLSEFMHSTWIESMPTACRLLCYHYTNDSEKAYDRNVEFQIFQTWIFPYTFSKCHIKKKPK